MVRSLFACWRRGFVRASISTTGRLQNGRSDACKAGNLPFGWLIPLVPLCSLRGRSDARHPRHPRHPRLARAKEGTTRGSGWLRSCLPPLRSTASRRSGRDGRAGVSAELESINLSSATTRFVQNCTLSGPGRKHSLNVVYRPNRHGRGAAYLVYREGRWLCFTQRCSERAVRMGRNCRLKTIKNWEEPK